MKHTFVGMMILFLVLVGLPGMGQAATITKTFFGTIDNGYLSGATGTGSFTYDDALLIGTGMESLTPTDGIAVSFTFDSQIFSTTHDVDYPDFPMIDFVDSVEVGLNYLLVDGENGVAFNDPFISEISMYSLTSFMGQSYDFEIDLNLTTVPEPTTMLLFSIGLIGLVGISRRKK